MSEENHTIKITFMIDGVVVDQMTTDDRWAAILLSEPTMIETTGIDLMPGDIYDLEAKKFTRPEQIIPAMEINLDR